MVGYRLEQGPEGSPNFCFGLYDVETGECLEFVQSDWDYPGLADRLGWPGCASDAIGERLTAAFDFLAEHAGEEFDLDATPADDA